MTFTTQLRTNRAPIMVASGPNAITIRVEAADLWETARVTVKPDTTVDELGAKVVAALFPEGSEAGDFVMKFRGWELLDPRASMGQCGIVEGSIVLLAIRRRRPVR